MMAAILNSAMLYSALLVFPLKLTHTCQDWFPPFAQKKLHSFILTQLDDGSYLEICHLWISHFAQKKLHSFILTQLDDGSLLVFCHLGFWHLVFFSEIHSKTLSLSTLTLTQTNSIWLKLIHSCLTWWWQPSWILPSLIQTPCFLLSDSLHKHSHSTLNLTQTNSIWLKLGHLSFSSQSHSHLPRLVPNICTKTSLIHSDSTWWWQPSWILPCWIQTLPSWILTPCYLLSESLKNTLPPLWIWLKLIQSDSNSFILA